MRKFLCLCVTVGALSTIACGDNPLQSVQMAPSYVAPAASTNNAVFTAANAPRAGYSCPDARPVLLRVDTNASGGIVVQWADAGIDGAGFYVIDVQRQNADNVYRSVLSHTMRSNGQSIDVVYRGPGGRMKALLRTVTCNSTLESSRFSPWDEMDFSLDYDNDSETPADALQPVAPPVIPELPPVVDPPVIEPPVVNPPDGGKGGHGGNDGDHDNGHGNDDDHDDDSNPGRGKGGHGTGKQNIMWGD